MKVRDDRGVRRRLAPVGMSVASSIERARRLVAWHMYARYQNAVGSRYAITGQRVALVLFGGLVGGIGVRVLRFEMGVAGVVLLLVAAACGVAAWLVPSMLVRARDRARAALAEHMGVCPSCEYSLEGLEAESDGCVVCPECGGAWGRECR
jgi:hypothetical protein